MRRDPNTYSIKEREAILSAVHHGLKLGKNVQITAREHGITQSIFYRWERERALGTASSTSPPSRQRRAVQPQGYCNQQDRERLIPEIRRRIEAGATVREATQAVGISEKSWYRWTRKAAATAELLPAFRPVELAPEQTVGTSSLSLLSPQGYRVEGLSVEDTIQLLRALG